jgi:hypothetical protein
MKWIWMLLIFFLWTSWIGRYAIWFSEGSGVITDAQARYEYLQTGGKPAITVVKAMNEAIAMGNVPPNVTVYGCGMEQYRFLADFKLIGGLYGWASHAEMQNAIDAGGAKGLYDWLRKYKVDFLAIDQWTIDFSAHEYRIEIPYNDPDWNTYFEKLNQGNQNSLFKLRVG